MSNQSLISDLLDCLKLSEVAISAAAQVAEINQELNAKKAFEDVLAQVRKIILKAESEI